MATFCIKQAYNNKELSQVDMTTKELSHNKSRLGASLYEDKTT